MIAPQLNQRVAGVIENMSAFACPHCGEPIDMFGVGGGQMVSEVLTQNVGQDVKLLGKIPFDPRLREGGDKGEPLVIAYPDSPAAKALTEIASNLGSRPRGLVGMNLGVTPTRN
jgi:ATP-binding protein involved in chromosome partitioning